MVILNEYKNIGGFNVKPYTSTAASYLWEECVCVCIRHGVYFPGAIAEYLAAYVPAIMPLICIRAHHGIEMYCFAG